MKYYIKTCLLSFLVLILLLFILLVDTIFYHVPSFIKIYRIERELTIIIAFLILYSVNKSIFNELKLNVKKSLLFIWGSVVALFLLVFTPYLALKKYLVLWDNNPFLAEYPLIWNAFSTFCTFSTITILYFLLLSIRNLLYNKPGKFSTFEFRALVWSIVLFSTVLFFIEDRYSFEQITILQGNITSITWILGGIILMLSFLIGCHQPWLDILNKKEKYTGFGFILVLLPVSLYLISSRLLMPVYAYSTIVKGFTLSTFAFINIYLILLFFGFLFRLPTASLYDRVSAEIVSITKISQMISANENIQQVFDSIVQYACKLTESDACWLELRRPESRGSPIVASANLSDFDKNILSQPAGHSLGHRVIENKEPVLIHNVSKDDRTAHLRLLNIKWKSLLAVPLIKDSQVVGILYSAKKYSYAFDEKNLNTLTSLAIQVNIALSNSDFNGSVDQNPGDDRKLRD